MSRNIKEIGKELLGKSLNSFHRKTGLTQLEKNNEMQDGILDGILSQVDDAYIEKLAREELGMTRKGEIPYIYAENK